MNTDLKKAIIGLIHNLSVKSYNRTRVNDAIDKIVESSGGGGSDDGVPIFYVFDANDSLRFKLIQGKPKVNEFGGVQPIICIDYFPNNWICLASICFDFFSFVILDNANSVTYTYSANKSYVDDFLALNVGDVLAIDKSELKEEILYGTIALQFNKNFGNYSFYMNKLQTLSVTYYSNGVTLIGHVIKVDQTNHNLYLSIGDEVWKYTYTGGGMTPYSNITFVEVVQS